MGSWDDVGGFLLVITGGLLLKGVVYSKCCLAIYASLAPRLGTGGRDG